MDAAEIDQLLPRLLDSGTFDELRKLVEDHEIVALSMDFDRALSKTGRNSDEDLKEQVDDLREILKRCREEGVSVVFESLLESDPVMDALQELINARDPGAAWSVLGERKAELLSPEADELISRLLVENAADPKLCAALKWHQELLRDCREHGIAKAFTGGEHDPLMARMFEAVEADDHFVRTGDPSSLERAIAGWEWSLSQPEFAALEEDYRLESLVQAAGAFVHRFQVSGDREALERAIEMYEKVIENRPANEAKPSEVQRYLGTALHLRYCETKEPGELDRAIEHLTAAAGASGSNLRAKILPTLGLGLRDRYLLARQPGDLENAIAAFREAMERAEHPQLLTRLQHDLSGALRLRYERVAEEEGWQPVLRFAFLPSIEAAEPLVRDHPELLKPVAEARFEQLMAMSAREGDEENLETFEQRRNFLSRCRELGVKLAMEEMAKTNVILEAFQVLDEAKELGEIEQVLLQHPELLDPLADKLLKRILESAASDGEETVVASVGRRRNLLRRCRVDGVEATITKMRSILDAFTELVNTADLREAQRILEANPQLLSPLAQQVMEEAIESARALGDSMAAEAMMDTLLLCVSSRTSGVADAVQNRRVRQQAEVNQTGAAQLETGKEAEAEEENIRAMVREMMALQGAHRRKERIALSQRALTEISPVTHLGWWLGFKDMLALALLDGDADEYAEALRQWEVAIDYVKENREAELSLKALLHQNVASAYRRSPLGSHAENLEKALEHVHEAIRSSREMPAGVLAINHRTLGSIYHERIRGDRATNLDQAIEYFQQALAWFTRERSAAEWADLQQRLGSVYAARIRGIRAENLELALTYFQRALEEIPRDRERREWSAIQTSLGGVYLDRFEGSRMRNIEEALGCYRLALEASSRHDHPKDWAVAHANLANAYFFRVKGDRADNLEQAIEHYRHALEILRPESEPNSWASAQMNLGLIFDKRIHGDARVNERLAIEHLHNAWEVFTFDEYPADWAKLHSNLATIYVDRLEGDAVKNAAEAVRHFEMSLRVRTKQRDPESWAYTQLGLGNACSVLARTEDVEEHLPAAQGHFESALEVFTREDFPEKWALVQYDLGRLHALWPEEKALTAAIAAYENSLQIYTGEIFPRERFRSLAMLGALYFGRDQWEPARVTLQAGLDCAAGLWSETFTEQGRREILDMASPLRCQLVFALLRLGRESEALTVFEQGRTRLLVETLTLQEDTTGEGGAVPGREALAKAWAKVQALEAEMRQPPSTRQRSNAEVGTLLAEARRQLREAHDAGLGAPAPADDALEPILRLIPPGGALVAPLVTWKGSAVFIVPSAQETVSARNVLFLSELKTSSWDEMLMGDEEQDGWLPSGWSLKMGGALEEHKAALQRLTEQLWEKLMRPVCAHLKELGVALGGSLLVMPSSGLALAPLHAAGDGVGRRVMDDYEVTWLPSARAYATAGRRAKNQTDRRPSLLAVTAAGDNLPFAGLEGRLVAEGFAVEAREILEGAAATAAAMVARCGAHTHLHFGCHGYYSTREPLLSGLVLAGGQRFTLSEMLAQFRLPDCRLIVLSACETGKVESRHAPEEYLGFASALMSVGAPAVISSLWEVSDLSTMLTMVKFYEFHLAGASPAAALRRAQAWLRDVTAGELAAFFDKEREARDENRRLPYEDASDAWQRFAALEEAERPFAHPYYWAAFTCTGA